MAIEKSMRQASRYNTPEHGIKCQSCTAHSHASRQPDYRRDGLPVASSTCVHRQQEGRAGDYSRRSPPAAKTHTAPPRPAGGGGSREGLKIPATRRKGKWG